LTISKHALSLHRHTAATRYTSNMAAATTVDGMSSLSPRAIGCTTETTAEQRKFNQKPDTNSSAMTLLATSRHSYSNECFSRQARRFIPLNSCSYIQVV